MTAASALARASAARRADSRTSQRSISSSASGTPWARYSASTRSYHSRARGTSPRRAATQPRLWRTWVAASAWPIDSWSSSARRKSASAARERAAVDLEHAAVAQQARLPQRVARAAERRERLAVALQGLVEAPELLQDHRALALHLRALVAVQHRLGRFQRGERLGRLARPASRPATRLMRATAARRVQPAVLGDRDRAPQVLDGGAGVPELDRGQPERALGGRAGLVVGGGRERVRRRAAGPRGRRRRRGGPLRRRASSTVAMNGAYVAP